MQYKGILPKDEREYSKGAVNLPGSGVIIGEMKISDMICITEAEGFNALKGADLFDY
jgi:hypothetical protein